MRLHHTRVGLAGAALLLFGGSAPADAAAGPWVGDAHAAVRLLSGTDAAGQLPRIEAGLEFRFGPGWHGYWRTPGDAGVAPQFDWSASINLAEPAIAWPAPTRLVVEGLQNSVYTGGVVLPAVLRVARPGDPSRIAVSVNYAVCSEICVPREAVLALDLPAGPATLAPEAAQLDTARGLVPGTAADRGIRLDRAAIETGGGGRRLVVDLSSEGQSFRSPDLFVEGDGYGLPPPPVVDISADGRQARLTVGLADAKRQIGDLRLTVVDGSRSADLSVPATDAISPIAPGWLAALATALLGGLILNLMPCVLPVLSIKLIGLTRHSASSPGLMRPSLVATALGITASFGLLAGGLIALQQTGATLGWGIQFQQPWFLAAMATLTVLFAASFFDWLPIGLPARLANLGGSQARGPLVEAFLTGALATLLATPCSAPFVGTAVGFALAQGPVEILAVFLALGTGMAAPYWLAALVPDPLRFLPRPGAWMVRLRQGLGVVLLGTAAWLLVVLGTLSGPAVALAAAALLATLLAYRAWPGSRSGRPATRMVTAVLALAPLLVSLPAVQASVRRPVDPEWRAFDAEAVPGLVAEGKTVLVDVTASWCLTCKVNDLTTLHRPALRERLAQPGVVRMRADWSRPDAAIAAYLKRFGRYGIPLDVVYGPGRPNGEALPELLTTAIVNGALDRAAGADPLPQTSFISRKAS